MSETPSLNPETSGDAALRSIRVRILDRDYPLRVAPADEAYTLHLAKYIDGRLRQIRNGIPHQPDLTHAIIGTLELAEELFAARAEIDRLRARVEVEASDLAQRLDDALAQPEASGDGQTGEPPAEHADRSGS